MTLDKLDKIAKRYGKFCSFAVWNPEDLNDYKIIKNHLKELRTDIIFVGLNASGDLEKFQNFHKKHQGGRDKWYLENINNPPFRGAYMTDICKCSKSVDGSNVLKHIKNESDKHKKSLSEEIKFVCGNKKPFCVTIGTRANYAITKYFSECFRDKTMIRQPSAGDGNKFKTSVKRATLYYKNGKN